MKVLVILIFSLIVIPFLISNSFSERPSSGIAIQQDMRDYRGDRIYDPKIDQHLFFRGNVYNNEVLDKEVSVEISIYFGDENKEIYHEVRNVTLKGNGYSVLTWDYTPTNEGKYITKLSYPEGRIGASFIVTSEPLLESEKICSSGKQFDFPYSIKGGEGIIKATCLDESVDSILIYPSSSPNTKLYISIPRIVFESKWHDCKDTEIFVLRDGKELIFEKEQYFLKSDSKFRNFIIPISQNTNEIEIGGTRTLTVLTPTPEECQRLIQPLFSPHEQIKYGFSSHEVLCKDNLKLIFKDNDSSPVCVKPESIPKLIERGWAKSE